MISALAQHRLRCRVRRSGGVRRRRHRSWEGRSGVAAWRDLRFVSFRYKDIANVSTAISMICRFMNVRGAILAKTSIQPFDIRAQIFAANSDWISRRATRRSCKHMNTPWNNTAYFDHRNTYLRVEGKLLECVHQPRVSEMPSLSPFNCDNVMGNEPHLLSRSACPTLHFSLSAAGVCSHRNS